MKALLLAVLGIFNSGVLYASSTSTVVSMNPGRVSAQSGDSFFKSITVSSGINSNGSNFNVGGGTFVISGGSVTVAYRVKAQSFVGDGSGLTGVAAAGNYVLKAGDSMSGPLTLLGSTLTITGNQFSVGGGSFSVAGGSATVAYQLTVGNLSANSATVNNGSLPSDSVMVSSGGLMVQSTSTNSGQRALWVNNNAGSSLFQINQGGDLLIGGQIGVSSACTGSQIFQAQVSSHGIIVGGSCAAQSGSGGGGGSSTLAVTTGNTSGFLALPVSSPTAVLLFNSLQFTNALQGTATAFVQLSGVIPGTFTVQGNAFSVGGSSFVVIGSSVGIGNNPPNANLDVSSGTIIARLFIGNGAHPSVTYADGQNINSGMGFSGAAPIFKNANTTVLTIQGSSLGLGGAAAGTLQINSASGGTIAAPIITASGDTSSGLTNIGTQLTWVFISSGNPVEYFTPGQTSSMPASIQFGGTGSKIGLSSMTVIISTPGAQATLAGSVGFKVQTGTFSVVTSTNGYFDITGGTVPSLSGCGTGPSLSAGANNHRGAVTIGSAPGNTCTVTWAAPGWASTPVCVLQGKVATTGAWIEQGPANTVSIQAFSDNASGLANFSAGDTFSYICLGN